MIDSLELAKRQAVIFDRGPMYNEFAHDHVIREPWNAYSSLFFFIPVIFWLWYLRGSYRKHGFLVALLPLLFLNGLGSTLFHAFRSSNAFLILDWLPAALMSFSLSVFFWHRVVRRLWLAFLVVFGFYSVGITAVMLLKSVVHISSPSVGYFFSGAAFLVPVIIDLFRHRWRHAGWYVSSLLLLLLSLTCRVLDYPTPNPFPWMPQGTHFLWHVFSSFAVFTLGFYVYLTTNDRARGRDV